MAFNQQWHKRVGKREKETFYSSSQRSGSLMERLNYMSENGAYQ